MKVWLKLLVGSLLGVVLGFLLPDGNPAVAAAVDWTWRLAIQVGRYSLVPAIFFAVVVATHELRQDGRLWGTLARSAVVSVAAAAFLIVAGLLAVVAFPPARIPILMEGQKEALTLDAPGTLLQLLPSNALAAGVTDGTFLAPLYVFAFIMGAALSYDRTHAKGILALLDSLSRLFYHVVSFFSEILGAAMIALGAYWAVRFRSAANAEVFRDLMVLLAVLAVVLGAGVLPLFLFLAGPKAKPWKQLYGALGPTLAGFFSGDLNFAMPVALRHAKESHGVKRRSNAVSLAFMSVFARAGSGMVAAVSLIVIIKSYSSLGVTLADLVSIFAAALGVSFLLAKHPGDGAFAALAVLCGIYGRGFEAGYLILKPIAFYLAAIGTLLDVLVMSLATYAIGRSCGYQEDREARHFI